MYRHNFYIDREVENPLFSYTIRACTFWCLCDGMNELVVGADWGEGRRLCQNDVFMNEKGEGEVNRGEHTLEDVYLIMCVCGHSTNNDTYLTTNAT